jgi:hypothetical protein
VRRVPADNAVLTDMAQAIPLSMKVLAPVVSLIPSFPRWGKVRTNRFATFKVMSRLQILKWRAVSGEFIYRLPTYNLRLASNGHGEDATPDDESRHARFPHLNPLPEGEEANESLREFHVKHCYNAMHE